ncbi:MAG: acyl-CoA reductase [Gemmatimonadetes bacterium]|nr:acyl-CoA reductase [Gemmatimonadota bacterium]
MSPFDAFHLPGLEESDVERWETRPLGRDLALRFPLLHPAGLARLLARMREARARTLSALPVARIARAIDRAAARLADPADPLRVAADVALPAATGLSAPMARHVLDRALLDWREPALHALLADELGDPAVLDDFRPRPARPDTTRHVRAFGPALAFHVFAGNVPGVAVTSIVRSLLVKAATLGKTAADEPALAPLFARALADVCPELADVLAVTYWPGGHEAIEAVALREADAVVVYGGGAAEESLRRRTPPGTPFLAHGPRYSFGLIGREALTADRAPALADDVAHAVALFDQQGCVSPHMVYVEQGGEVSPREFAALIAGALERLEAALPRGSLRPGDAAAIHAARGAAEFRTIAGADVVLHASPGTEWTVAFDADPAFTASCLNRFLWVKPLADLGDVLGLAGPVRAFLQTVAIAAAEDRRRELGAALGRIGAARITTFRAMPWPPPAWHHDGRGPLLELLRWVDLES